MKRYLGIASLVIVLALLTLPVWSQTSHSITIQLSSYTQGSDLATGFNYYRSTTTGTGYTKLNATPITIVTGPPVSQFVDVTGVGGTKYFYVMTAVDASGDESAFSNEVSGTFLSNPATPAGVVLQIK